MRVAFVNYLHLSYAGGAEYWMREIAAKASQRGEITLLTSDAGAGRSSAFQGLFPASVVYRTFRCVGFTTLPNRAGFRVLRDVFRNSDVVYFSYWPGGLEFELGLLQELTGTPVIAGHHGVIRGSGIEPITDPKRRLMYRVLGPRNVRFARVFSAHHVQIPADKLELSHWGIGHIFEVPAGIECDQYPRMPKYETFTILFLGTFSYQKGLDLLPALIEQLDRSLSNYRLIVAGSGGYDMPLESLRRHPKVELLGFVGEQKKMELLARSHAFVLLSRFESFSRSALESTAAGTPVVAFRIPGPDRFIRSGINGFLVNSLNEMAARVVELNGSWKKGDGAYDKMVETARTDALQFDWSLIFPKIWSMIEDVSQGETLRA
jgi:glycosyltransferase involved in cell wall biosynthesis